MSYTLSMFEKLHRNLYRTGASYWRLFATGTTPNGCWLIAPKMVELQDINASTGLDVYGTAEVAFDIIGTVPANNEYVPY